MLNKTFKAVLALVAAIGFIPTALAQQPTEKALNFQPPATEIMERIDGFHDLLLWIIFPITIIVLALMAYVMVRFRAGRNPVPSKTTHNTFIEVIWTAIPVLILVVIAIQSFPLLTYEEETPEAGLTIKAIGNQWNWTYEYPDHGDFSFTAIMLNDDELQPGQPRLLATDNHVVVPVDTNVKLLVTASDVIHAWTIPAFGVKVDAVPGRLNELWFNVREEGIYYGQCSELCGKDHGFMPITVEVVSKAKFESWVNEAREEFADAGIVRPIQVAMAN